jgi:hypothetical protein
MIIPPENRDKNSKGGNGRTRVKLVKGKSDENEMEEFYTGSSNSSENSSQKFSLPSDKNNHVLDDDDEVSDDEGEKEQDEPIVSQSVKQQDKLTQSQNVQKQQSYKPISKA